MTIVPEPADTGVPVAVGNRIAVLNEGIARWQLATGTTAIEGWTQHLPRWVRVYFAAYLVIWTISVSAALSACRLGIARVDAEVSTAQREALTAITSTPYRTALALN